MFASGSRAPCGSSPTDWRSRSNSWRYPELAREPKDIAPQVAGGVARAVLAELPSPQALFNAVVRRIRADSGMNHRRAAILKAYLIRNRGKEVSVALNKDHPDEAYQLGRL